MLSGCNPTHWLFPITVILFPCPVVESPIIIWFEPVFELGSELSPIIIFEFPVVITSPDLYPSKIFFLPVVIKYPDSGPIAIFLSAKLSPGEVEPKLYNVLYPTPTLLCAVIYITKNRD